MKRQLAADADRPTARTLLPHRTQRLSLLCNDCHHQRAADLAALIEAGKGDVPIIRLRWRGSKCGSRRVSAGILGEHRALGE